MKRAIPIGMALGLWVGCGDGGYDWHGTEASVALRWTLGGLEAGAEACAALGGERVRLTVRTGAGLFPEPELSWPCAAGEGVSEPFFAPATLDVGLELLDPDGGVVAYTPFVRRTFAPGGNDVGLLDLEPLPGSAAADVAVTWTLNGAAPGEASCGAVGGVAVRLDWEAAGLAGRSVEWACAAGTGRAEALARSGVRVDWRLELLDVDGFVIARTRWTVGVTLDAGENLLPAADFSLVEGTASLSVGLVWGDPAGGAAGLDCASAGVAVFGYELRGGDGRAVDAVAWDGAPLACVPQLSWTALPPDTYSLTVDGVDGSGTHAWSGECRALAAVEGGENAFECAVPRRP